MSTKVFYSHHFELPHHMAEPEVDRLIINFTLIDLSSTLSESARAEPSPMYYVSTGAMHNHAIIRLLEWRRNLFLVFPMT